MVTPAGGAGDEPAPPAGRVHPRMDWTGPAAYGLARFARMDALAALAEPAPDTIGAPDVHPLTPDPSRFGSDVLRLKLPITRADRRDALLDRIVTSSIGDTIVRLAVPHVHAELLADFGAAAVLMSDGEPETALVIVRDLLAPDDMKLPAGPYLSQVIALTVRSLDARILQVTCESLFVDYLMGIGA